LLLYKSKRKIFSNILFNLQSKNLNRLRSTPKALVKLNLTRAFDNNLNFNYIDYPLCNRRVIRLLIQPGTFFGLGTHTYYTLDISKKHKLINKNLYLSKLQIKKDS